MSFHISLVARKGLRAEIYGQLRQAILDARLRPGEPLPATREMARVLNVSRNTVEVAYERLIGEGFVTSRVGSGTYVSLDLAAIPERQRRPRRDDALRARPLWNSITPSTAFATPARFDFRTGIPDASLFPFKTWRRFIGRELRSGSLSAGTYGHPAGHTGLRSAIARHVAVSRGTTFAADDIVITNGTQQALDIIARVLLAPGDVVAMEDPGYQPPRRLFSSLGLSVVGVPVDHEGLMVNAIPRRTRAIYVTPSHQYPLGVSMSVPRRLALLAWAERHDAAIIEDDYDSEFRFGGRPVEPLHSLDSTGRVIYVGSFSKTMLPTLRLGFAAVPRSIRAAMHSAKFVTDWHTPLLAQGALARFIDEGVFARHVRRMARVYGARRTLVTQLVSRDLSAHFDLMPSDNGLHITAMARKASVSQIDTLVRRAAAAGVAVQPLSMFAVDRPALAGLTLAYGGIATADIGKGLRRLRDCL